ncbi:MAG: hypothetical protein ACAI44_27560 [Candidatus Sericytochromatia bacterium]
MALDLSLISAQEIIRQRHPEQQGIINIFSAPLSQLNFSELEEARLLLLDSLYDVNAQDLSSGISYTHYHLPVLMTAADLTSARPLVEAWIRSALFLSYNLVLLPPSASDTSAFDELLKAFPEAQSHFCLRALDRAEIPLLMDAVSMYLPAQEPHMYVGLEAGDPQLLDAMASGFLGLSLYPRLGFQDGHNGFLLESSLPRTMAYQLVEILEDPERDWEILQRIAYRGQNYAKTEREL